MHDYYFEDPDGLDDFPESFDMPASEVCKHWSVDEIVDFYIICDSETIKEAIKSFEKAEREDVCIALGEML